MPPKLALDMKGELLTAPHNTRRSRVDSRLTGLSPNDSWIGFPFCTHLIMSSMTESERERPNAAGSDDEPSFDESRRALPSDTPFSGMTRDGMLKSFRSNDLAVRLDEEGVREGGGGSLPSHDRG